MGGETATRSFGVEPDASGWPLRPLAWSLGSEYLRLMCSRVPNILTFSSFDLLAQVNGCYDQTTFADVGTP